jgi:hypothetical protein
VVFAIPAQSVLLLHSFPETIQSRTRIKAFKQRISNLQIKETVFFSNCDRKIGGNMKLFIKRVYFTLPGTVIKFIHENNFFQLLLRCKDIFFPRMCSNRKLIVEEQGR